MHQPGSGDYASQYYPHHYPNPNPNPADFPQSNPNQPPFASAPLYSQFPSSDPANYSSGYSNFPQNPDPIPGFQNPQFPHLQSFNNPPQPLNFPQEFNPVCYSYYPGSELPQPALNYVPNPPSSGLYEDPYGSFGNEGLGDGVYAYDGGKVEPYGARGMGSFGGGGNSGFGGGGSLEESDVKFDDYGRSLGPASGSVKDNGCKIVRAVPKMESQQDVKNGVQKFRVKLLPEGASVTTMDVLCQIGLDGIRMLDPSTNRTLRIYPLENVTRWDVLDSSIFTFWSKSPVDIEPRRIRLQSNSYTTNTILDIVTAATVQLKEMGGKEILGKGIGDAVNSSDQQTEKKKGFADWMNLMKPGNEEKDHWVPDEAVSKCTSCGTDFGAFVRRHHCRNCGDIFCDKCTQGRIALTADEQAQPVRVCDRCMAEVSQRLSNAKDIANKSTGIHSHEDLARKLQEEMERNRKSFSGSKSSSDGSGKRMREVACPICTVHLQVQVPSSGSETIECGVCQHPFLVSAH